MLLDLITPLILAFNEAPNIVRSLAKLRWAKQIIVIDSGSTDATLSLLSAYSQVRIIYRPFDSFARQCNFGLSQIKTPWVLSLDADYVLSDGFVDEVKALSNNETICAYRTQFRYCIKGHPLRSTLYPPRTVLFRRNKAYYYDSGHGHRVEIAGTIVNLKSKIYHDDRKPLNRWLDSQRTYAQQEADHLLALDSVGRSWPDRLRLAIWPAAPAVFLYTLLIKCCVLDGWPGWYYALQRTYAELILSLELLERRLRDVKSNH